MNPDYESQRTGMAQGSHTVSCADPSSNPFLNGLELIGLKALNEQLRTLHSKNFACVRVRASTPPSSRDGPDDEVVEVRATSCNFSRLR
jgi:flagellar basal body P-ring protein FlgI